MGRYQEIQLSSEIGEAEKKVPSVPSKKYLARKYREVQRLRKLCGLRKLGEQQPGYDQITEGRTNGSGKRIRSATGAVANELIQPS